MCILYEDIPCEDTHTHKTNKKDSFLDFLLLFSYETVLKMAQQVGKGACCQACKLNLIPGTHMVKGEKQLPKVSLSPLYMHCGSHITTSLHINIDLIRRVEELT